MAQSFAQAQAAVTELVERFRRNLDAYRRARYKEAEVRHEFIDPFFEALGWDVHNRAGYAEQYKDVVHEESLRVAAGIEAPDYTFRIGGVRKFFVEAKKPAVNVRDDAGPAYQLRRYAWSAKLPLSILTDFEEFAVYDCTKRPRPQDKAGVGRVAFYTFEQYPERLQEIWNIFAKESVLRGSFDRYAQEARKKRGTSQVDAEFLREIEGWRDALARNLALRNPGLSVHELNYAVQAIIDRIIFLRVAEDRGIEEYGRLMALRNGNNVYQRLVQLYRQADSKYNAGLFDLQADTLTPKLILDDKVLKSILAQLYYPESPYEFSVLGADILGQVYEQFLGKVIRLTPHHRAVVEEKPEVKKAGGVYYTPTYIVDYIVKHTVGELVKGKTPRQISKLRVLDPACGSGSFLLGAYQYLLDYHLNWYIEHDPEKWAARKEPPIYQGPRGEWRLTTAEKKRILLNNIYGVDIDRQAVEVTKLSLLLKVLEGESQETLGQQLRLWQERALPDLGNNIKCGNSLIGPDYWEGKQMALFDAEEVRRINAFDWQAEFPEVMAAGGFDAVIGNPPYVRQETLGKQKAYFQEHYHVYHGIADLYVYFIERAISLLRKGGLFSFIVANKWMRANYGQPLRRWLKTLRIEEIIDFGDLPVFQKVTTYPCILRICREQPRTRFKAAQIRALDFNSLDDYVRQHQYYVSQPGLSDQGWSLVDERTQTLLNKLRSTGVPLAKYIGGKIYRGVLTGLNKAFVINAETRAKLIAQDPKSVELIKPFLIGRNIKRYDPPQSHCYLIFTRRGVDIKKYPAIERYLTCFKEQLMPKPKGWKGPAWKGRKPGNYKWYEIQDSIDYYREFEKPKILFSLTSRAGATSLWIMATTML